MASLSVSPWIALRAPTHSACLTLTGSNSRPTSLTLNVSRNCSNNTRSHLLHCSFVSSPSSLSFLSSSLSGTPSLILCFFSIWVVLLSMRLFTNYAVVHFPVSFLWFNFIQPLFRMGSAEAFFLIAVLLSMVAFCNWKCLPFVLI